MCEIYSKRKACDNPMVTLINAGDVGVAVGRGLTWVGKVGEGSDKLPFLGRATYSHLVLLSSKMAGMGDGYVGTAEDSARIRRMDKKRSVPGVHVMIDMLP